MRKRSRSVSFARSAPTNSASSFAACGSLLGASIDLRRKYFAATKLGSSSAALAKWARVSARYTLSSASSPCVNSASAAGEEVVHSGRLPVTITTAATATTTTSAASTISRFPFTPPPQRPSGPGHPARPTTTRLFPRRTQQTVSLVRAAGSRVLPSAARRPSLACQQPPPRKRGGTEDRQLQPRRGVGPEEQGGPGHRSGRGMVEVAAVVGVDLEPRGVGACHVDPDPVPGVEDDGGGPHVDDDFGGHTGGQDTLLAVAAAHAGALDSVGDEHRASVRVDVGEAHGKVEVGGVGTDPEPAPHPPDHGQRLLEDRRGE